MGSRRFRDARGFACRSRRRGGSKRHPFIKKRPAVRPGGFYGVPKSADLTALRGIVRSCPLPRNLPVYRSALGDAVSRSRWRRILGRGRVVAAVDHRHRVFGPLSLTGRKESRVLFGRGGRAILVERYGTGLGLFGLSQPAPETGVFVLQMLNLKVRPVELVFEHARLVDEKRFVDRVLFSRRAAAGRESENEEGRTSQKDRFCHP